MTPLEAIKQYFPGLVHCLIIASASYVTWSIIRPVSPMMWAFIYSIITANVFPVPKSLNKGIGFASSNLLKSSVGVLGFVTSALIIMRVGWGIIAALMVISASIILSLWLGRRFGLSPKLMALIGAGTSVCGASAIAALKPAIGAEDEEAGVALSAITLFGLASMFLYPLLFSSSQVGVWLSGSTNAYAIWVGSGVHETAQVIAAAGAVGPEVVPAAMLIKSVRIFMIGPIVFIMTWICCKLEGTEKRNNFVIPLFAVVFVVGSLVCALLDLNAEQLSSFGVNWAVFKSILSSTVLPFTFATSFAGVGSKVSIRSMMKLGSKPLIVAALVAISAGVIALLIAIVLATMIGI